MDETGTKQSNTYNYIKKMTEAKASKYLINKLRDHKVDVQRVENVLERVEPVAMDLEDMMRRRAAGEMF